MDLNLSATAAAASSSSNSSLWSLLYEHSQTAFGQLFSLLNKDWVKGRPCTHGVIGKTKNGPVRGKTFTLVVDQNEGRGGEWQHRRVNAFLAIPYARAGTKEERFKKPLPVEPWREPLNCTQFGPRAIQYDMFWDTYLTPIPQNEEKCLHISVFAPDWESTQFSAATGRPVMVFVHGGGFLIHSAGNYGDWNMCQNLCLHDVVVCVVQYRLGLLGFLSTGDDRCPGNFGLWDQLAAFQWVKENIASFGGDPNNVTAFGQSAGAASIDLLSLSPLAKGLFKRVILMGGNGSTDWAVVKPERTQAAAIRMAKRLGWKGADSDLSSLLAFLRSMPAQKLAAPLIGKSAFNRHRKGLEFCPVVDGELIPAPVAELRRRISQGNGPKLEVIIGGTEFEALLFVALGRNQADLISLRKYLRIYIDDGNNGTTMAEEMRKQCEQMYLDGVNIKNHMQMSIAFLRLHSDVMMNNSMQRYCQGMMSSENKNSHKIFLYNMTHFNADEFGFVGLRMPFYAATHCHDLRYLIGKGLYSKFRPNWDDRHMMRIVGTLFTNFAKFGDPNISSISRMEESNGQIGTANNGTLLANGTKNAESLPSARIAVEWLPIDPEHTYRHLELCLEPKMSSDYQGRRFEFWKKLEEEKREQEEKN